MNRKWLVALLVISFSARSETPPKSVYSVNLGTDLAITASAAVVALVPYAFAGSWIQRRCPCPATEVPSFDRGGIHNHSGTARFFSDVLVGLAVAGPVAANALALGINDVFWEDAIVFAQALMVSGALVSVTKVLVQRPLPLAYQNDPQYVNSSEGYRSFYSGHTTTVATALTAAAVTIGLRYDQPVWPWLVAAGATTGVAALRVLSGNHFISDTAVGAAVGATVGILVPLIHKRTVNSTHSFSLAPTTSGVSILFAVKL